MGQAKKQFRELTGHDGWVLRGKVDSYIQSLQIREHPTILIIRQDNSFFSSLVATLPNAPCMHACMCHGSINFCFITTTARFPQNFYLGAHTVIIYNASYFPLNINSPPVFINFYVTIFLPLFPNPSPVHLPFASQHV